jgi:hypothetical protein
MMALHDKAFFQRLLTDPRGTLAERALREALGLTDADVDAVVRVIERGHAQRPAAEHLAMWDRWNETGLIADVWIEDIWPEI